VSTIDPIADRSWFPLSFQYSAYRSTAPLPVLSGVVPLVKIPASITAPNSTPAKPIHCLRDMWPPSSG
jgi:hypothetical protein